MKNFNYYSYGWQAKVVFIHAHYSFCILQAESRAGTVFAQTTVEVLDPDAANQTYIFIIIGILMFILIVVISCFAKKIYQDRVSTFYWISINTVYILSLFCTCPTLGMNKT